MLMKLVTLLAASSLASIAFAGEQPRYICEIEHAKFKADASKDGNVTVRGASNKNTGGQISTILGNDGSAISILTIPAQDIKFFANIPFERVGTQCVGPLGDLHEVFVMTIIPNTGKNEL